MDQIFTKDYRRRPKQDTLLSLRFLSASSFPPRDTSESVLACGLSTQRGDLCNTFPRPDGGVRGDRSSRYLPEQSAASRCRIIVSESRGSGGHVPALPEWKQISSFNPRFVGGAYLRALKHNTPSDRTKGGSVGWSRTSVPLSNGEKRHHSSPWQNTCDSQNHA